MKNNVVTRIAPSPTGQMHIGTVRTALFSYLYAKQNGGKFLVRIEDTDTDRNKPEWTKMIWDDFEWCGLIADQKYVQSEHLARHTELLKKLVAEDKAYISKEPSKDDANVMVEVVRFRNPNTTVTFDDVIHGSISFDTTDLKDFVIARSIEAPLYHFAVVVDDADAGVTHVLRGEDILSSTPRQILIQEALGFPRPIYVHLPLILSKDKKKLSKRKHVVSLDDYRVAGYLSSAIINYLALLGWNPGTDEEIFTMDQLIQKFSLDQLQKSGAVFDDVKLKWVNREHMLKMSVGDFKNYAKTFVGDETRVFLDSDKGDMLVGVMRERSQTFGEIRDMDAAGDFKLFYERPEYPGELLLKKETAEATKARLEHVVGLLEAVEASEWSPTRVKDALWPYAESEGRAQVLWPTRVALSGREKSPDPFTIAGIIGRDETLARLHAAFSLCSA